MQCGLCAGGWRISLCAACSEMPRISEWKPWTISFKAAPSTITIFGRIISAGTFTIICAPRKSAGWPSSSNCCANTGPPPSMSRAMSDKLADSSPFPFNGPSPRRSGQSDNEFENGFGHPDGESAAVRIRKSVSPTQFLAHAGTQKSSGVLSLAILPLSLAALLSSHPGSAAAAESKKAKAEEDLFTKDQVLKLQIKISEEGMAQLRQYEWSREAKPTDRIHVPATVREGAAVYTNVAIHVKGAAGSFRPLDDKPGFTLNFDKMAKGQRFHGLEKLSLNNSVQDPTFTTDKLCREVFVKAGVPVPRAEYATVELNGRSLGLYVLTEGWNK